MNWDAEFIKPEIRDGWEVTEKSKKVWFVFLDLIEVFSQICKKYNLRWYLCGGALIGAVRHHGFIPWDDDVDLMMPREDYNKFLKIAQNELKYPYHLRTTLSEKECFQYWASLCNSETTGNRETCLSKQQNNGISIDILPYEGCEDNIHMYAIRRKPLYILAVLCNTCVNDYNTSKVAVILRKVLRKIRFDYRAVYCWLEKYNSKYPWAKYNYITYTLEADPELKRGLQVNYFKKEWFNGTVDMQFENTVIPVPIGYHEILTQEYGNYMEFPPIESRKAKHDMIFEPDVPYKEFCNKMYGVEYND
jgi:lipopolysaccharide cholinephosphotransferase